MKIIQRIVKLMPTSFVTFFKRNPKLTALYSRTLVKSGLFYGRPSTKKLEILTKELLKKQSEQFRHNQNKTSNDFSLLIITSSSDIDACLEMLLDLDSPSFSKILFFCATEDVEKVIQRIYSSPITNLKWRVSSRLDGLVDEEPILVINNDDVLVSSFTTLISKLTSSSVDVCYFDRAFYSTNGEFVEPELYPDWNADLQLSTSYIRTCVYFAKGKYLLSSFDLEPSKHFVANWMINNFFEQCSRQVHHIPIIGVFSPPEPSESLKMTRELLKYLLAQANIEDVTERGYIRDIQWKIENEPLVSLIIPTYNGKDLVEQCVKSILSLTTYKHFEIVLVDNNSDDKEAIAYFHELSNHEKIKVLRYPHPFNYSAINNFAVSKCNGEIIGLINNDIKVITPQWLEHLLCIVLREDVGSVGAKLLYPDNRVQHAGVVLGYGGGAGHAHKFFPRNHDGYLSRLAATNNFSAVTAACLLVKREDYLKVGGLNELDLTVAFNDVDFCLRLLEIRERNVYCAIAELYHFESISRGADDTKEKSERFQKELQYLRSTWRTYIEHDPAYNQCLTLKRENFAIVDSSEYIHAISELTPQ